MRGERPTVVIPIATGLAPEECAIGVIATAYPIFVKSEPKTGLLVLSIELLRRSLAVEVDCTLVALA